MNDAINIQKALAEENSPGLKGTGNFLLLMKEYIKMFPGKKKKYMGYFLIITRQIGWEREDQIKK